MQHATMGMNTVRGQVSSVKAGSECHCHTVQKILKKVNCTVSLVVLIFEKAGRTIYELAAETRIDIDI